MQKSVETFIQKHRLSCGIQIRYIDLTSEIGELGKELLKNTDYGKTAFRAGRCEKEELGDCLFSLLALASEMGVDIEEALQGALRKYEERFSETGEISSGR